MGVHDRFPGVALLTMSVAGFGDSRFDETVEGLIRSLEESPHRVADLARAGQKHVDAWHGLYRGFGFNPRRRRPSFEALTRRLATQGRLPRLNPAADFCNLMSIVWQVPTGGYDQSSLPGGCLELRFSEEGEVFEPISGDPLVLGAGQVVYAAGETVVTSGWNWRDSARTRLAGTRDPMVLIFEAVLGKGPALVDVARAARSILPAGTSGPEETLITGSRRR
jgi:DNA/RNA-binding domain of Phe-tRNA-synthetase-like protein